MSSKDALRSGLRVAVAVLVGAAFAVAGWALFVRVPGGSGARLAGVVLALAATMAGLRFGANAARSLFPGYDVAEVAVEGPITRDGGGGIPSGPVGASADGVVEQVERADASAAEALVVRLNTPGGEVVPSDDIRLAVEEFDGPVVAYATDVCASGGYWIASGCDHVVAREGSLVGSVGVIGSRLNAADLAERLGISYERFAAGKYKDAGNPLKDLTDDERAYLQGLIDDYYRVFVERVAEGRDLDPAAVRDTEAKVYLGHDAREAGLVDEVGTREAATAYLEDELGRPVAVEEFEPDRPLAARLAGGAAAVTAGAAAGLARVADGERLRLR